MNLKTLLIVLIAFILGILSTIALTTSAQHNTDNPSITTTYVIANEQTVQDEDDSGFITRVLGMGNEERASPYDRIPESSIIVEKNKVTLNIENAQWSRFTDTNSMDPVIDDGANAIQIVPKSHEEIFVGDIISYKSRYADGIIIHRVIETGFDSEGWYCLVKGDNNPRQDPGKVRFSQIRRVVVAIVY